jgi:hypothetical protein
VTDSVVGCCGPQVVVTVAWNCAVWPGASETLVWSSVTLTIRSSATFTVSVARAEVFAALVAVMVTVAGVFGAVKAPVEALMVPAEAAQVTDWFAPAGDTVAWNVADSHAFIARGLASVIATPVTWIAVTLTMTVSLFVVSA